MPGTHPVVRFDTDVLIAGYGPAGATLANLLGALGLSAIVIDAAGAIYDKPRAITADHEILRVFQACGLADEIAADVVPHPGTDFIGMQGQVIKRFYPAPPPYPLGWLPNWQFVQPRLEATLRRGVSRWPQLAERLGQTLVGFEQDAQSVTAQIKGDSDDSEYTLRSRWLVACDGARSTVRRQLNAAIEDLAFDEWWIVVDTLVRGPVDLPPRAVQYCRPSRPGTYMVGPGALRRWEIKVLPGERPEDFDKPEVLLKVLREFVDPTHLEIWRVAVYRFHALVVERWRHGRVFLMGDAAHQMPPFLGQGLCAAVRDAANLAWKLHGVERLGYADSLLDTYGEERKPHSRTIVAHAKAFGLIIGELDEAAARRRDEELGALLASGRAETVRQRFIPGLQAGLIGTGPGAGQVVPQPFVRLGAGDWQRLDDVAGPGFLIVASAPALIDEALEDEATRVAWQGIGGRELVVVDGQAPSASTRPVWVERDGVLRDWFSALGACAVLVRPDRYAYAVVGDAAGLRAAIDSLAVRLAG
jgi:3-(3-hydroxy-phenyl)propionate hydroxylase